MDLDLRRKGEINCMPLIAALYGEEIFHGPDWFSVSGSSKPLWVCVGRAPGVDFPILERMDIFVSVYVELDSVHIDKYNLPDFDDSEISRALATIV